MNLHCDLTLAAAYASPSQRARVLSESWFLQNAYCLACDSAQLRKTTSNTPATDFLCPQCHHGYELKTFHSRPRNSLVDGAYGSMMRLVTSGKAPTLCLLERTQDWRIRSLTAIHSSFLLPNCIEQRPPLGPTARRAGWVGCNIRLDRIAADGEIGVIENSVEQPAAEVRSRFQRFLPLVGKSANQRGWTLLTLQMVRKLRKKAFTLREMYAMEEEFAKAYPDNLHIKDKIRQQLQVLRDLGILTFEKPGEYRILD
jgi:type II restriction enzyme